MTNNADVLATLTNEALLSRVRDLAQRERAATVHLIAALAELDSRRLYLGEGYSSLFTYCTQALRLSEHAAYGRIEAARAARRFPIILELLAEGAVTLTTVCLLARHLTRDNHRAVLDAARDQSKRDVERQIAALHPLPAVPPSVRKLPSAKNPFGGRHGQRQSGRGHRDPSAGARTETYRSYQASRTRTLQGAVHPKPSNE